MRNMFRAIRIAILLFILLFVSLNAWLTSAQSTDWDHSLRVTVYPINADGSDASRQQIERLTADDFRSIEEFAAREAKRYGQAVDRPVRVDLGNEIHEQPPTIGNSSNRLDILLWSLKMRFWVSSVTDDNIRPDVRIFLRYHSTEHQLQLENSVGIQKGMFGIVNAYASRQYQGSNNVIIAHELLHTLGATDKYDPGSGQPLPPDGLAEPDRVPLYPQVRAEIMGGRIAQSEFDAMIPKSLRYVVIGPKTAEEVRLID